MGKDVKIMIPTAINKLATDYNDVINLVGTEPIKQDYGNAYSIKDFYEISAIEQHKNAAVDDKKMEIKEIIAPQKNKEITL